MDTVVRWFGDAMFPTLLVAAVSILTAVVVAVNGNERTQVQRTGRVLAIGAVLTVVTATMFSTTGWGTGHHDVVFAVGQGGLQDYQRLMGAGGSHAARLWLLNFLIYVPVGLLVPMGFPRSTAVRSVATAVLVASATSVSVETAQFLFTERVAATDDWILNTAGALLGALAWLLVSWARHVGKTSAMATNRPSGFHPG